MSVVIDGTKGITASGGLYAQTTFTGTYTDGIVADYTTGLGRISVGTSDGLAFYNAGVATTELMRIDSTGNVGIGTSSPASTIDVRTANATVFNFQTSAANGGYGTWFAGSNATYIGSLKAILATGNASDFAIVGANANNMVFGTNSTERMRIDSSGRLIVGATSANSSGAPLMLYGGTVTWGVGPNSGGSFVIYNGSNVGQYMVSGGTTWNSSSDERLKTELTPFENAAQKVCSLRAGTGRYLTDEETVSRSFLIAQDVQAVLPEAVNVQSDEMGTLGLAYTDLIPLLTAAIQEQQALITQLQADVAALKGQA